MTWHEMKWMNEWMKWVNEWMNERKKEMNEWMNEWMSEWNGMNECMNERNEWMNEICRPHLPKVFWNHQFFWHFYVKSSFLCSPVRILPTSSSKSGPNVAVFYDFYVKPSSCYSPVRFLSTTFADRGPHPRKQRPYFGDHGSHCTWINAGFRAREPFQTWIQAFPKCSTSQLLDDDVVDMMMWLTWWWERWPWQLSVARKFSH